MVESFEDYGFTKNDVGVWGSEQEEFLIEIAGTYVRIEESSRFDYGLKWIKFDSTREIKAWLKALFDWLND